MYRLFIDVIICSKAQSGYNAHKLHSNVYLGRKGEKEGLKLQLYFSLLVPSFNFFKQKDVKQIKRYQFLIYLAEDVDVIVFFYWHI